MTNKESQVKKLKNLEDLKELQIGDKLLIKADQCPFSNQEVAVLQTGEELRFINSSIDLTVGVYTPGNIIRTDEEGILVVSTYTIHNISNKFQNLGELSESHKSALSKAGYEIPMEVTSK